MTQNGGQSFSRALGRQLKEPRGLAGSVTGVLMRLLNDECNSRAVDALSIRPTDSVLELGFGPGHGLSLMAERAYAGRVYGVDISSVMFKQATARNRAAVHRGQVVLHLGSFDTLPFADQSLDGVLAVNVAYFWDMNGATAREVRRVMRIGGRLALYVTDRATMKNWSFAGPETHVQWDAPALVAMLRAGGFPAGSIEIREVRLRGGVNGLLAVASAA